MRMSSLIRAAAVSLLLGFAHPAFCAPEPGPVEKIQQGKARALKALKNSESPADDLDAAYDRLIIEPQKIAAAETVSEPLLAEATKAIQGNLESLPVEFGAVAMEADPAYGGIFKLGMRINGEWTHAHSGDLIALTRIFLMLNDPAAEVAGVSNAKMIPGGSQTARKSTLQTIVSMTGDKADLEEAWGIVEQKGDIHAWLVARAETADDTGIEGIMQEYRRYLQRVGK